MIAQAIDWARARGNRWLHLGGGVGARADGVFAFKAGFSQLRWRFRTLRVIADETQYRELGGLANVRSDRSHDRLLSDLSSERLDELPTLVNMRRGEMSLVGPRPLPIRNVPGLYSATHARCHEVRPDITGRAQANGRNALTWDDQLDINEGATMRSPRLQDLAARICAALPGAFGAIIVQVFVDGQPETLDQLVGRSR